MAWNFSKMAVLKVILVACGKVASFLCDNVPFAKFAKRNIASYVLMI